MDFSRLTGLAGGYLEARVIQAAVSLGVFDAIENESRDARSVAASMDTDPRATELLLDALASLDLLEKKNDLFSLTEVSSAFLVKSSPRYYGDMILFDASLWDCWGSLDKAVRSGKPVRAPDMYQGEPAQTERFINAMHALVSARGDAELLSARIGLEGVRELLDIGPGPGTYALTFCRRHPELRATLFDLPGTLKITEVHVRSSGLGDRIRLVAGDYRTGAIPGTYQLVFLSNIIHAEGAEENSRLMAKLYPCVERGGRIVIKDHILDDSLTRPPVGALFALLMLLTTEHGRCYSFNEVREWLDRAGFKGIRQIPLSPPLTSSLVIGEKQ